ncbi:MAG: hypothetical protein J4F39_09635, partial [Candidatus Latescibacteria bacterium]|nr:hypothetical protein [Candidatus Latescibacterota bacterium]
MSIGHLRIVKRGHFDKLNDHALTGYFDILTSLLRQAISASSTQAAQAMQACSMTTFQRNGKNG